MLDPHRDTYLPGNEHATLTRQIRYGHDHYAWGLYIRQLWLDDHWDHLWYTLAELLTRYADDDGYAGFYRNEHEPFPTLLLIERGKMTFSDLAKQPKPFGFSG